MLMKKNVLKNEMKFLLSFIFLLSIICNVSLANSTLFDLKRRADVGDAVAQNSLGHIYL